MRSYWFAPYQPFCSPGEPIDRMISPFPTIPLTARGNPVDTVCGRRFSAAWALRMRLRRSAHAAARLGSVKVPPVADRIVDIGFATILLVLLAPLVAALAIVSGSRFRTHRVHRLGRHGERFNRFEFNQPTGRLGSLLRLCRFHHYPALLNLLRGDMTLVGPRAAEPGEFPRRDARARRRLDVRPGLVSTWWIRKCGNVDYGSELEADEEYVESRSGTGNFGILLRAVPALLYGEARETVTKSVALFGLSIDNMLLSEAVEWIMERLEAPSVTRVAFLNADCINITFRDRAYRSAIRSAHLRLADGIGFKLAGSILGRPIKQNVNGTDLFPQLCEALSGTGKRVFLLGAKPGIAERVRDWILMNHANVVVCGCRDGFFPVSERNNVTSAIADARTDLLLVAMGAPRQDVWLEANLAATGAKVGIGVGGLFDFYSGTTQRAPQWMREMGCEWLYRLYKEPGRMWRRYLLGNLVFLYHVIRERSRGCTAHQDSTKPTIVS